MHHPPASLQARITIARKTYQLQPNIPLTTKDFSLLLRMYDLPKGQGWQVIFETEQESTISACALQFSIDLADTDYMFCNGYQSWSESREYQLNESIPPLRAMARPFMGYYGDYHLPAVKSGAGYLHSWTWTYLRKANQAPLFVGSLSEKESFTLFQYYKKEKVLHILREQDSLLPKGKHTLLDLFLYEGDVQEAYAQWFDQQGLAKMPPTQVYGWTSWYQFYNRINEALLKDTLSAFQQKQIQLDYFQIDDGYQEQIGDWLSVKKSFPNGMDALARSIRSAGYEPGIWLAPYVAAAKSNLVKSHPDWLQKDPRGKPLKAGYNPMWGGFFYALDPLHEGVRNYLRMVFRTILTDWGYSLIKLDFLYAACIYPPKGWTRAALCHEAIRFLRELAGSAKLLGCGVPLGPTLGLFDYCRIAADIHLRWEHKPLSWVRHRERVSTLVALRTVLARFPLNGRAWLNDPDVFLLREQNQHLSRVQRRTIARINALCGSLHFNSDRMEKYGDWQQEQWAELSFLAKAKISDIQLLQKDVYRLDFRDAQQENTHLLVNLRNCQVQLTIDGEAISLAAYASSLSDF